MKRLCLLALLFICLMVAVPACSREEKPVVQGQPGEQAGVDEHTEMMVRQHQAMLDLQEEWIKAKDVAEQGKTEEARAHAAKMEESAGQLDNFMLHKNTENKEEFFQRAREFKGLITSFRQTAERGDAVALKKLTPKIDNAADICHQSFR